MTESHEGNPKKGRENEATDRKRDIHGDCHTDSGVKFSGTYPLLIEDFLKGHTALHRVTS